MADDKVKVEYGDSAQETAVLLLAAVEELKRDPSVVTVDQERYGFFVAPADVVKKAGLTAHEEEEEEVPDRLAGPTPDFFAENEGETKPEQKVASDNRPLATSDPNVPVTSVSEDDSADEKPVAKKATAKKAAAKKSAAKK